MRALRLFYRPRLVKCLLFLAFLANLGLIQSLQPLLKDSCPLSAEEQVRRRNILYGFAEEKVTLAKEMISRGQVYSPRHYFADLKSIDDKERELEVQLGFDSPVESLSNIASSGLGKGFTKKDFEIAAQDYRRYLEGGGKDGKEAIEKIRGSLGQMGWQGILWWLFILYLKCLPLIFVLFVIWIKEREDESRYPRPFRFGLMLAIYPAVLVRLAYQWFRITGRRIWSEAELRRTKQDIFTFLTNEEVERIKSFARSNVRFPTWRIQLRQQGLKPQHGLMIALLVTFIFLLLPRAGEAEVKVKKINGQANITIEQMLQQHLPRMSIDGSQSDRQEFEQDAIFDLHDFLPVLVVNIYKEIRKYWRPEEVYFRINHIPISAVRPEVYCFNNLD